MTISMAFPPVVPAASTRRLAILAAAAFLVGFVAVTATMWL